MELLNAQFAIDLGKLEKIIEIRSSDIYSTFSYNSYKIENSDDEWMIHKIVEEVLKENRMNQPRHLSYIFFDDRSRFFLPIFLYYLFIVDYEKIEPYLNFYYNKRALSSKELLVKFVNNHLNMVSSHASLNDRISVYGRKELIQSWIEKKSLIIQNVNTEVKKKIFELNESEIEIIVGVLIKNQIIEQENNIKHFLENNFDVVVRFKANQNVILDLIRRLLIKSNTSLDQKEVACILENKIMVFKKGVFKMLEYDAIMNELPDASKSPKNIYKRLLLKQFPEKGE